MDLQQLPSQVRTQGGDAPKLQSATDQEAFMQSSLREVHQNVCKSLM